MREQAPRDRRLQPDVCQELFQGGERLPAIQLLGRLAEPAAEPGHGFAKRVAELDAALKALAGPFARRFPALHAKLQ